MNGHRTVCKDCSNHRYGPRASQSGRRIKKIPRILLSRHSSAPSQSSGCAQRDSSVWCCTLVAGASNSQTSSFRLKWLPSAAEFSHRLLAEMWLLRRFDSPTKVSFAPRNAAAAAEPKTGPRRPRALVPRPFAKRGRESIGRAPTDQNRPI